MPTIVILGAHTAVAKNLAEGLEDRDIGTSTPGASSEPSDAVRVVYATLTEHLTSGLELIDEALLRTGDLFVVTFQGAIVASLVRALRQLDKPVIDATGTMTEADWVWPLQDGEAGRRLSATPLVRIPVGWASPVVGVMRALWGLKISSVSVVTMESAAVHDQTGMDALSAQVRGVFSMQAPDAEPFDATLAFNVLPSSMLAQDEALEEEITSGASALGLSSVSVMTTRTVVPTFSAEAAIVELAVEGTHTPEVVSDLLGVTRGFRERTEPIIAAMDAVGRDDILFGRIRCAPHRIRVWLTKDRLRVGSATQAVMLIAQWLDRQSVKEAGNTVTS